MMQEFKAECTINLYVEPIGGSSKFAWVCSIRYLLSRLVVGKGYLGHADREEAQIKAALFGLKQAQRLKQEKVAIASSFSDLLQAKKTRKKELQSDLDEIKYILEGIRLKKLIELAPEELAYLRGEVLGSIANRKKLNK